MGSLYGERMRSRVRGTLTASVLLAVTLMSGCGSDDSGEGDDSGGGSDFTDQSAEEISDAAKDAMSGLEAVTIDGTLSSSGTEITITISVGEGGNCTGSFGTQGATAEILGVDGTTWFRPDEAFWELYSSAETAPQIMAAVGDRWVTLPADDTSFTQFCDIEQLIGQLIDSDSASDSASDSPSESPSESAEYTKGDLKEIDGEETIEIISERPEQGTSSGYVLVEGDHYLVKISKTEGEDPGEITFSGFDEQPDVEAPAEDEQIALEDLQSGSY